jgi:hypothetical protein
MHRDAIGEEGAPHADVFDAAERLGVRWPPLPWTCPGCGTTYENHRDTIATVDLEVVMAIHELIRIGPRVLSELGADRYPKTRAALAAFADWITADEAEHGAPAAFLCIRCDIANHVAPVVHVLFHGRTLCGMHPTRGRHKWVRLGEVKNATCKLCKQLAADRGA